MGGGLKLLQVGQAVRVQHHEYNCSITVLPAGQPGPKVIEVGVDYVIFEDEAEGVTTRIPMHLLKSVGDEAAMAAEAATETETAAVAVAAAA
jgi:hypothetical protein